MMMPDELTLELHKLQVKIVDLPGNFGTPIIIKQSKLFRQIHLLKCRHYLPRTQPMSPKMMVMRARKADRSMLTAHRLLDAPDTGHTPRCRPARASLRG